MAEPTTDTELLAEYREAWKLHDHLKADVEAWMAAEGNKGRLRYNNQAPQWMAYTAALARLEESARNLGYH